MKLRKKLFIMMLLATMLPLTIGNAFAESKTTYDDTKTASWTAENEVITNFNGLEHIYATGYSTYNKESEAQQINVFKMKTDGVTSKLVSWAIQDGNTGYKRGKLSAIALDYEKNHPGWIVVAGINADQYALKYGGGGGNNSYLDSAPYYPSIMDGEVRFPFASVNGSSSQYVGFKNDGSNDGIVDASSTKCFALYILDENDKEVYEFELAGINKISLDNQTTVWTPIISNTSSGTYISKTVSSTLNNVYYVENADLSYTQTSSEYGMYDVFFGKGTITNIVDYATLTKGQFAIETNNEEVKKVLSKGTKIKVQAKFENDEMNDVETAAGYHMMHRNNGKDSTIPNYSSSQLNSQYDAKRYNRSIFGQTADGTYVLLTADKSNSEVEGTKYQGLRFWETNAVLKHYGVTEAYQQDGGGSVTAIIRNENGKFDVVNSPSDSKNGVERSIFNGLFFVVKDPGFTVNKNTITRNSIEINVKDLSVFDEYKNIKVIVNNQSYDLTSQTLTIDNLEEDTEHIITIKYDIEENGQVREGMYQLKAKTKAFTRPSPGLEVTTINKESIIITKEKSEYSSWIQNVVIHLGDETYNMGNLEKFEIDNLISETKYNIYFTYDIVEPSTGNVYNDKTIEKIFTTLAVELPQITKLEITKQTKDSLEISYEYIDKDSAVKQAQLIYNGKVYSLTKKRGSITINNYDVDTSNTITLKLFYYSSSTSMFADEINEEITIENIENDSNEKGCKSCKKSSSKYFVSLLTISSLLILILRKKH